MMLVKIKVGAIIGTAEMKKRGIERGAIPYE